MITKDFPTLYKMSQTGKIQQWDIRAVESECRYEVNHGQHGGAMQTTSTLVNKGKNIGKINETSAWTQACLEAESKWKKQKDRKGYSEYIPTSVPFRPMLAQRYDKDGCKIKFPCYADPKYDGARSFYQKGKFLSRQGKEWKVLKHLENQMKQLPLYGDRSNIVFDGELYNHKMSFQDIIGAIKRDEPNKDTPKIEYWIYDMYDVENPKMRYEDRLIYLRKLKSSVDYDHLNLTSIKFVDTQICESAEQVWPMHDKIVNKGFEGIMLRNANGVYKINGRSADLQKVKSFMDEEFEIVDAYEGKGKNIGMCTFICKTNEGGKFGVMPKGDEFQRRQYLQDWRSGKIKKGDLLTVVFFEWSTSDLKIPRFPIGTCVRSYE